VIVGVKRLRVGSEVIKVRDVFVSQILITDTLSFHVFTGKVQVVSELYRFQRFQVFGFRYGSE
jgi:hypothetical protein